MIEIFDIELARARQGVHQAELALERAEQILDEDCGLAVNLALCSRIRSAQRRVVEARERQAKVDSPAQNEFSDDRDFPL